MARNALRKQMTKAGKSGILERREVRHPIGKAGCFDTTILHAKRIEDGKICSDGDFFRRSRKRGRIYGKQRRIFEAGRAAR